MAIPACPFPLQPKRPRCHQCSSVCVLPCLPRRPQPSSGGTAGGGRAEGALHPRAVLQGKPCFPSKGCNPGLTGLAGGQGPWLSLWGGGWVPPRLSELLFLGRAADPPRTGPAPSCGSCEPTHPIPLQGWAATGLAVDGDGLGGVPTLLSAAPGAALLLGRGWSSSTTMSSLSLAPFT